MDAHRKSIIHGSGQSRYRTPPALVAQLRQTFHFAIDLAATAEDSICQPDSTGMGHAWLGPGSARGEDSLSVDWNGLGGYPCGFVNPPYSLSEIRALKETYRQRKENGATPASLALIDAQIRALRIENWARKAFNEAEAGFTTIGVFPYAPQTEWFRFYVMGHGATGGWRGFAALDFWRLPHRVSFLLPDGSPTNNAGVNTCIIHWGPNPGFVGPWVPSGRYWSYR